MQGKFNDGPILKGVVSLILALVFVFLPIYALSTIFISEYNSPFGQTRATLLLFFSLGFIFQLTALIAQSKNILRSHIKNAVLSSIVIIFVLLMPFEDENQYDIYFHSLIALVGVGVTISTSFKNYFSPRINEQTILIACVLLGYLFIIHDVSILLWFLFLPGALLVFTNIYTNIDSNQYVRVILYVFFLIVAISICAIHLRISDMSFFFNNVPNSTISNMEIFTSGMLIGYITPYVTYLLRLLPIQGKHESWEQRKKKIRITMNDFMTYFNPNENFPLRNTLIILMVIVFLYINHKFYFISESYVITIALILVRIANTFKSKQTTIVSQEA